MALSWLWTSFRWKPLAFKEKWLEVASFLKNPVQQYALSSFKKLKSHPSSAVPEKYGFSFPADNFKLQTCTHCLHAHTEKHTHMQYTTSLRWKYFQMMTKPRKQTRMLSRKKIPLSSFSALVSLDAVQIPDFTPPFSLFRSLVLSLFKAFDTFSQQSGE